jgi:hypothetical protein
MPMTDEERERIISESRATLERTAHIRPRTIIDVRPEDRIAKWKREGEAQTAREEAEIRRRRRLEKQGAAAEHMGDWIDRQRMLDMLEAASRGVGEAIEEMRVQLHKEFTTKCAELSAQLERERNSYQRDIERDRTTHQRERDALTKQLEVMQAAHARELATIARLLTSVEQRVDHLGDDLFGGGDNFIDAFAEAWRRHQNRGAAAQIRRVA